MTAYWFDAYEDGVASPAEEPLHFETLHLSRVEALRAISEIMVASVPNGPHKELKIEIRADGSVVFWATLALTTGWRVA